MKSLRTKTLDKFYKEDAIRCFQKHYDSNQLKSLLLIDDSSRENILSILESGLKKEDLITILCNSKVITDDILIHFLNQNSQQKSKQFNNILQQLEREPIEKGLEETLESEIKNDTFSSNVVLEEEILAQERKSNISSANVIPAAEKLEQERKNDISSMKVVPVAESLSQEIKENINFSNVILSAESLSQELTNNINSSNDDLAEENITFLVESQIIENLDKSLNNERLTETLGNIVKLFDKKFICEEKVHSLTETQIDDEKAQSVEEENMFDLKKETDSVETFPVLETDEINENFCICLNEIREMNDYQNLVDFMQRRSNLHKTCMQDICKKNLDFENFKDKLGVLLRNHSKKYKLLKNNYLSKHLDKEYQFYKEYIEPMKKIYGII